MALAPVSGSAMARPGNPPPPTMLGVTEHTGGSGTTHTRLVYLQIQAPYASRRPEILRKRPTSTGVHPTAELKWPHRMAQIGRST